METIKGKTVDNNSKYPGIYAIVNLSNNKFYIGSSNNLYVRRKGHFNDLKGNKHKNNYLQNAFNKNPMYFIMIEIEKILDLNVLRTREQFWMDELKSYEKGIGYNINTNAEGLLGYQHTQETREKLRKAHTGRKLPEEQRKKISKTLTGRSLSSETRRKISESNKKTKLSKEFKDKHEEKATSVIQMDIEGNVIKVWKRIKEASHGLDIHSSNIIHCCKGKRKTAGGYRWAYFIS